jgi:pyruvate,water dikinase
MKNIIWFKRIGIKNVPEVGGKTASLGEMYSKLTRAGIRVPNGFAITASAYRYFLKENGLDKKIREILKGLDTRDLKNLQRRGRQIREAMVAGKLPEDMRRQILQAYRELSEEFGRKNTDVAVRSSATAEDLPGASFAGQQETYLNVSGEEELLSAVKKCFASLFTDRAISYREDKGFGHAKIYLSVAVQKMVRSDKASSGIIFTIDPDTGFSEAVVINSSWGLGEFVVQGEVIPDEFQVFKPALAKGFDSIISKKLGSKERALIYGRAGKETRPVKVGGEKRRRFTLTDREIVQLAKWAVEVEKHYGKPMDLEWAKDGESNRLFVLQARPETVQSQRNVLVVEDYSMKKTGQLAAKGIAVGAKIAAGRARVIRSVKQIGQFRKGEVLVTTMTDPDWEPIMKIAAAIVTDKGGRTSHAAIISRELGIPCVVGTAEATRKIKSGEEITVDCSNGRDGLIWRGKTEWSVKKYELKGLKRPKTKVMMNIGSPGEAYESSFIPADGVGLAREEFIIASEIKIHPLALINFAKLKDAKLKKQIGDLTAGFKDKTEFFTEKLSQGVAQIAAAFYPRPVIVRFSDFKTNEYASLIGGRNYEPKEENPMIGWRGASRYYDPRFKPAFGLECRAIKRVRDKLGLDNIIAMIPFCRTPEEGERVLKTMAEFGLKRGENGLKVYVMAEIPSNVILADEFLDIFDGFSIGSNDLTQLTLGIDRDNADLARIANEENEAIKKSVGELIRVAGKKKKYSGICGQAPSDYPEFARFLVREGIESISLNPDSVLKTTLAILKEEARK